MTTTTGAEMPAEAIEEICRAVAELPDRNSPEDWPEAMLVTHDELAEIVSGALSAAAPAAPAAPGKMTREAIDRAARYAIESDLLAPADWEAAGLYDFAHAITGGIGVVDDLRTLVVRLVRALRQAAPANDLADKAADYLRRHGLDGSPLRDSAAPQALATFSTHYSPQCQHLDPADASAAAAYARAQAAPSDPTAPFQQRVQPWLLACFGAEIAADRAERNHRFLEESLELVQSCGCTAIEAHQLVDYVYGRPVGEPAQETGGVMVTLAALCLANSLDMHQAGETELARIWTKVEAIRAKQAAKPKHSPLPGAARAGAQAVPVKLDHLACIEGGVLRYMSGRKAPDHDCELYAMPGGGRAPELYAAPAAVSAPKLPSHEELADLIAQGLRGTWYCGRAWEAWHVGTMSKNDFSSVDESDTPEELADAVLALLAAAPQVETATTGAATVVVASAPVVATTAVSAPKANHLGELIGCFDAALSEGLQEALAETTDERLKDLVERRLMYGYWVAVGPDTGAAPQAPAGEGGASSLARKDPP